MTTQGWIFLTLSWALVLAGTGWCLWRVMKSRRHWTQPEEDVKKLHHGEFND